MRWMLAIFFVISGITVLAGCGGSKRPEPPPGYVDPGTDPAAMGSTLKPGAPDPKNPGKK